MPFKKGLVPLNLPLSVENSSQYQFDVQSVNEGGDSVEWAMLSFIGDISGGKSSEFTILPGSGNSAGQLIASQNGGDITLDTGALTVRIDSNGKLASVVSSGKELADGSSFRGKTKAGESLVAVYTGKEIVRNGPVESLVRVDFDIVKQSNQTFVLSVSLYITAVVGKDQLEFKAVVKNSNRNSPLHQQIDYLTYDIQSPAFTGTANVKFPLHTSQDFSLNLPVGHKAAYNQAYAKSSMINPYTDYNIGAKSYQKPPYEFCDTDVDGKPTCAFPPFKETGYKISYDEIGEVVEPNPSLHSDTGFGVLSAGASGPSVMGMQRHMALVGGNISFARAASSTTVSLSILNENLGDHTINFLNHRWAHFAVKFSAGPISSPREISRKYDYPAICVAADITQYNSATTFKMIPTADQNASYQTLGISYVMKASDTPLESVGYWGA
ncbi:MAG: hypothetical protein KDD53_11480, partial [Bdellovibrionales bacterium]|nr:hypothetical protein [Bdellovibrionales bacterium]